MAYTALSFVAFEVLTAAKMNQVAANDALFYSFIGSDITTAITLGYAEVTGVWSAVSTAEADTSLSVTVTVPAGSRRVEVLAYLPQIYMSVDDCRADMFIREDSTNIGGGFNRTWQVGTGGNGPINVRANKVATAGSHTYKLRMATGTGTGLARFYADATTKAYITVRAY